MKVLFVVCVLAFGVGEAFGQGKLTEEKKREFEAQKVAFFTQELDLSPEEATIFWPLYNEMQKKKKEIEGRIHKGINEMNKLSGGAEKQYAEAVGKLLQDEEALQKVKKEYYLKMLSKLPPSKIWKLGGAERKFHRRLFDKLCRESPSRK
ncbi:MAG: hypothetical protein K2I90_02370 [Odoribacter sp.]|nr:hypothetical protein [Odoribacter sp.]